MERGRLRPPSLDPTPHRRDMKGSAQIPFRKRGPLYVPARGGVTSIGGNIVPATQQRKLIRAAPAHLRGWAGGDYWLNLRHKTYLPRLLVTKRTQGLGGLIAAEDQFDLSSRVV